MDSHKLDELINLVGELIIAGAGTSLLAQRSGTAYDIFGSPDDLKFKSCMTLFAQLVPNEPVFQQALARFFGDQPDQTTLKLLS